MPVNEEELGRWAGNPTEPGSSEKSDVLIMEGFMAEKQFVNLDQLIKIFPFLKRSRIYYLTNAKGIPFYRVGRSLVFEVNEVHAWIESGRAVSLEMR